jgi:hypothetical protein
MRYKLEALHRKIEVVWDIYNVLHGRMDIELQGHFQQREIINNLRHDSKVCSTLELKFQRAGMTVLDLTRKITKLYSRMR